MATNGTTQNTNTASGPTGSLSAALSHALRLLDAKPALAERQAAEILKVVPGNPDALLILEVARRPSGNPDAWRALGDLATVLGDSAAADRFHARQIQASTSNPALIEAATALYENRLAVAERGLKDFLKRFPTDVAAIRMLAEVAMRIGRLADAETLLARCLELSPGFHAARHNYALALYRQNKAAEAVREADRLLAVEPGNPNYRSLKAAALCHVGDYGDAIPIYRALLGDYPDFPKAWMSYGHALKTTGATEDGIAAYRRSIALAPHLGEAYWSLANLKTFRFGAADIAAMRMQLARTDLGEDDRLHFHFALGKALEDAGDHAASFAEYAAGNALRRRQMPYRPEDTTEHVRRSEAVFTAEFFARHAESGCPAPDPIFVVGLPRSGSTLIEQILASHSQVEGTMELPEIGAIVRELGQASEQGGRSLYPEILRDLPVERLREMGEAYIARTRIHRKTGRPFFIDKMPRNFLHIGLIRLILPNARIIDARRHPMATCFSAFKQHFARGQAFSYGLEDVGHYWRDYARLMAHFDAVMPGKIHRAFYEAMVEDTEAEVRRLLAYCGLPFEENCLRFHETERAVRTASSEQVRSPIFRDGLDQWQRYEAWLGPLKAVLGDEITCYPGSIIPQQSRAATE